jgi:hypothetical protein
MKKKDLEKARKVCEGELALLHDSIEQAENKMYKAKVDSDIANSTGNKVAGEELKAESERLDGVIKSLSIKENEFKEKIKEINFISDRLFSDTPLPNDSTLGQIIDEYALVSEALETHRTNIVTSLNNKGIVTPTDAGLMAIPEQIMKLPTLGGDLSINPPNIGAMIDTKDREYDVTNIEYVLKYSTSGYLEKVWTRSFSGAPNTVAVDSDGFVYIGTSKNLVRKTSPDGSTVWDYTVSDEVNSIAVDSDGFVYYGAGYIVGKLTPDGQNVWVSNSGGGVKSVAIDSDGFVYCGGTGNTVIQYDASGSKVWSYNANYYIYSITVGLDGYLYAGSAQGYVIKLDSFGNEINRYDASSSVLSVAIDSDNNFYAGTLGKQVIKFNALGDKVWTFTPPSAVASVVVDIYGFSYCSSSTLIYKISPSGKSVFSYNEGYNLYSIFYDSDSYIYTCSNSGDFKKYKDKYTMSIDMDLNWR